MGSLRCQTEQSAAHGGQVKGQGVVPPIDASVRGVEAPGPALVGTVPAGGLAVQQLFGPAGELAERMRYFCMGNALVVPLVKRIGGALLSSGI